MKSVFGQRDESISMDVNGCIVISGYKTGLTQKPGDYPLHI